MSADVGRTGVLTVLITATALVFCGKPAAGETPWVGAEYPRRFVLRALPPPAAGALGLLSATSGKKATVAFVRLPLRTFAESGGASRIEDVLLTDAEGKTLPLLLRPDSGRRQTIAAFETRAGRRLFFLYVGALRGRAKQRSPTSFRGRALSVRVLGRSLPEDKAYRKGRPLTLARFREVFVPAHLTGRVAKCFSISDSRIPFSDPHRPRVGPLQPMPREKQVVWMPRYAAAYEGLLRVPVNGVYRFALDTAGAAHLLIDGRPVCGAGEPDPERAPFAVAGSVKLRGGIHRVVVYHALCGERPGLSLLWQPPFAPGLMVIPAQAFPRGLPAVVAAYQERPSATGGAAGKKRPGLPFIHLELLGRARSEAHLGPVREREWVLLYFRAVAATDDAEGRFRVRVPRALERTATGAQLCTWVPAGKPVKIVWESKQAGGLWKRRVERTVFFAAKAPADRAAGLLSAAENRRRAADALLELEARLTLKSAPRFIYPDETAQIYLETALAPLPRLYPKHELERRLWWPPARPKGEYRLRCVLTAEERGKAGARTILYDEMFPATPPARRDGTIVKDERSPTMEKRKPLELRLPLSGDTLCRALRKGTVRVEISLDVGGVPAGKTVLRVLPSRGVWPAELRATADGLRVGGGKSKDEKTADGEEVLVLVPREKEADYRRHRLLRTLLEGRDDKEAFFLGDPLVENLVSEKNVGGLADDLKARGEVPRWRRCLITGPYRGRPVFEFLAKLEAWLRKEGVERLPATAVVSLGSGDVARQTPPHEFGRALDVLIDRLRLRGARRIVFLGIVPQPGRMRAAEVLQKQVREISRRHHLRGLDLVELWKKEGDWERRFRLSFALDDAVFGPVPNLAARKEIAFLLSELLAE